MFHIRKISMISTTLLLAACGGGGGGDSSDSSRIDINTAPVSITTENAPTATDEALGVATGTGGAFDPSLVTGVVAEPSPQTLSGNTLYSLIRTIQYHYNQDLSVPELNNVLTAVEREGSVNCDYAGSFTFSHNDLNNDGELSVGETLSIIYQNCAFFSAEDKANGQMKMTLLAETGTPEQSNWNIQFQAQYNNFTVEGERMSGDMDIRMYYESGLLVAEISGDEIYSEEVAAKNASLMLDFQLRALLNESNNEMQLTGSAKMASSQLNGSTTMLIEQALIASLDDIDAYPSAGVVLLSGENNSQLRITVLSAETVHLALDEDGDDSFETSKEIAWNELESATL